MRVTITTTIRFRSSPFVASRVQLLDIHGNVIGAVFMYADDDSYWDYWNNLGD